MQPHVSLSLVTSKYIPLRKVLIRKINTYVVSNSMVANVSLVMSRCLVNMEESDLYNRDPFIINDQKESKSDRFTKSTSPNATKEDKIHYPSSDTIYTCLHHSYP